MKAADFRPNSSILLMRGHGTMDTIDWGVTRWVTLIQGKIEKGKKI